MKVAIAKKWAAELRSGKYKQGKGRLRTKKNSFCCLGVLCNMHAEAHPRLAKTQKNPQKYFGHRDFLPKRVQKWAGMKTNSGYYPSTEYYEEDTNLTAHNDSGKRFSTIAKIIEKHIKDL